jgi:acetoin utilization deacetylase AcuC-like enzyme
MAFHPLERFVAARRLGSSVAIWYHPEYSVSVLAESFRAPNVEPRRGELVISQLVEEKLLRPTAIQMAPLCSVEDLGRFHPLTYLEASQAPEMLSRIFGAELLPSDVEPVRTATRRAIGGTIAAAEWALERRDRVAINLGGGFHHAEPDQGSGFCLYNDVGVTIERLRASGYSWPIGIVDLDYHQGNGNLARYAKDPTIYCYSIHGSVWSHQASHSPQIHLSGRVGDRRYLAALRATLPSLFQHHKARLVFFIAGTDVLGGDRLGTFDLSLEGVLDRDRFVLDLAAEHRVPVVVTLGGGYSSKAWWSSLALVRYALTGTKVVRAPKPADLRLRYEQIRKALDPLELQKSENDFELTQADLDGALGTRPPANRILDYYSRYGVELGLEQYGILGKIRARGYRDLEVEIEPEDPSHQMIRVRGKKKGQASTLVEVVMRRAQVVDPRDPAKVWPMLAIEWLLLQDPETHFNLERPPLPGQDHPGLGIAREIGELFVQICHRLDFAGIIDNPAHYHNAAATAGRAHFLDPKVEALFLSLKSALAADPVDEASQKVERGRVTRRDGSIVAWQPGLHVTPVGDGLGSWFDSATYRAEVEAELARIAAAGLIVR